MTLSIGSLFSGVGGLELGLEWAGLGPVLWQVEIDPFCRAVLAKHWPEVPRYEDVRSVRASQLRRVDLICGGFPCQDVSSAGKRQGLGGVRSGLWWEFARIVKEARPRFVVVENVASGAAKWLCAVRGHLHQLGYRTRALGISASELGALHRRARVFVIAHAQRAELRLQQGRRGGAPRLGQAEPRNDGAQRTFTDADRDGEHPIAIDAEVGRASTVSRIAAADPEKLGGSARRNGAPEKSARWGISSGDTSTDAMLARRERSGDATQEGRQGSAATSRWAPEPDVVRVVHGLSGGMDGRQRRARLRALGNAVCPPQAQVVGEAIRQMIEDDTA